jgi:predicted transcriptional regulator
MTLIEWMTEHDIVDVQIADAVGLTRPYITRIRNGDVHPSLATALAIWDYTARAIDIEELLPRHMRPSVKRAAARAKKQGTRRKPAAQALA